MTSKTIDIKTTIRGLGLVFGAIMTSHGLIAYLPTAEPWMLILGGLIASHISLNYV